MKQGDIVRRAGEDNLMTVEAVDHTREPKWVYVIWFDEKEKLRKLRFFPSDLILVARGSAGTYGLK